MSRLDEVVERGAKMAGEASARSRAVRGAAAAMAKAFSEGAPAVEAARLRALRAGDTVPDTRAADGFAAAASSSAAYDGSGDLDYLIEATSYAEAAAESLENGVRAVEADPVLEDAALAAEAIAAAIRAYLGEVAELRRLEGPAGELRAELRG